MRTQPRPFVVGYAANPCTPGYEQRFAAWHAAWDGDHTKPGELLPTRPTAAELRAALPGDDCHRP
jgi:hypothetical protein